jgi:hypothetical protein
VHENHDDELKTFSRDSRARPKRGKPKRSTRKLCKPAFEDYDRTWSHRQAGGQVEEAFENRLITSGLTKRQTRAAAANEQLKELEMKAQGFQIKKASSYDE